MRFGHDGLLQHFGAGIDLSAIIPTNGKVGSETAASLSANGYAHLFRNANFSPYLTFGYTGLFRDFAANGYNGGGGFNYWFGGAWGLMFEVRELVLFNTPVNMADRYTQFRVGFAHRSQ